MYSECLLLGPFQNSGFDTQSTTFFDVRISDTCLRVVDRFFEHKYPAAAPPPEEKPKPKKEESNWWILWVLLFAIVTCVLVVYIIRGQSAACSQGVSGLVGWVRAFH